MTETLRDALCRVINEWSSGDVDDLADAILADLVASAHLRAKGDAAVAQLVAEIDDWFFPDGDHPYDSSYAINMDEWRTLRAALPHPERGSR